MLEFHKLLKENDAAVAGFNVDKPETVERLIQARFAILDAYASLLGEQDRVQWDETRMFILGKNGDHNGKK